MITRLLVAAAMTGAAHAYVPIPLGAMCITGAARIARPALAGSLLCQRAGPPLLSSSGDSNGFENEEPLPPKSLASATDAVVESLTGGEVANVQFMITQNMRKRLEELGYSAVEVDRMEPSRAASIIESGTPNSKQPQLKPKTKRERFELQFTCNVCGGPNSHSISRHAYAKGTVIVTCPGCNSTHLIADNLNWIEDDFRNIEEAMAKRGTPVRNLQTAGVAASAASAAAGALESEDDNNDDQQQLDSTAPAQGGDPRKAATVVGRIDGIDEDQALRIREAVKAAKRKRRQDDAA